MTKNPPTLPDAIVLRSGYRVLAGSLAMLALAQGFLAIEAQGGSMGAASGALGLALLRGDHDPRPTSNPRFTASPTGRGAASPDPASEAVPSPVVTVLDPPEQGFFAKRLDYDGIPIKAPAVVVDEALYAAHERLALMLANVPGVRAKLRDAGAALHIIGRDQVTTDLPEWRHDKGKPLAEYNGLTRDQRTRGMGGLLTSCGEENLLRLEKDRYRGRDICMHEFAHNILSHGVTRAVREKVKAHHRRSLDRGLWVGSYAGSNYHEFFAELAMWYFGTHGDLGMKGEKPANGRDGLRAYDAEAFQLLDDFFSGRLETEEAGTATGPAPRETKE